MPYKDPEKERAVNRIAAREHWRRKQGAARRNYGSLSYDDPRGLPDDQEQENPHPRGYALSTPPLVLS